MSTTQAPDTLEAIVALTDRLKNNIERVIRGKTEIVENVLIALITGESILIEDVPGVGKTTLAKALAASLDMKFQRIQCTPDLLPADIFGTSVFNPQTGDFHFRKGPVFCNILLVDEINRASPRTQSALLEAMAEKQVTIEGTAYDLPRPFVVIATQNPNGFHGTFPLPESQLDRFLMQVSMDYPDQESEMQILYQESARPAVENLQSVLSSHEVIELQDQLEHIQFEKSLAQYLLNIVKHTRSDERVSLGCSPRASIKFFKAAKAKALISGRKFVLPDDIQNVAPLVIKHRLRVSSIEGRQSAAHTSQIVNDIVSKIDVPT